MVVWARLTVAFAGLMGMAGVALAAAGSHLGGGDLVRTASHFLLIHAAVVVGIGLVVLVGRMRPSSWLAAASVLSLGTVLFAADLAVLGFFGSRPLAGLAPAGGSLMIVGWLMITVIALLRPAYIERDTVD